MKKTILLIFISVYPAFSQKVAVLVGGSVFIGKRSFVEPGNGSRETIDINDTKPRNAFTPGLEVRVNPRGRVAFGVGYQRWAMEQAPKHFSTPWWIDMTKEHSRYDLSGEAAGKVLIGTAYVNFTKKSAVQPFIGIGAGYSWFNTVRRTYNIWQNVDILTPELKALILNSGITMDQYQNPPAEVTTQEVNKYVLKGVAGFNVYPAKHLMLSFDGGYVNGPAANFSIGLTF
ncbi:MAG: hypothetical protein A2831_01075 [Candidatus Yanofskybacteria bacterium RIFCSPHIGHO2_01_FULL_44_17]|uniref:Outer membrane protein beta-barrel domain-containing protein n=1 Tax=Candidatus Yanofskybacteria bacterium RIFCSPHIGHO2_01_FULL_44_17 TaxID=1802668 RepID=A0A1F8EUA4_9BACT|nr:MAG: hypothetical protein A2831_01075 [Candidatus Yanofskybacteria bacterium RIFCSPHIGHO2_01_FULL_44_17]